MQLKGKTILITGGASGIGLEAVKQFLANGAQVVITGRNQDKLDAAKKLHPAITAIHSDVAKAEDVRALLSQVEAMGGIDILYNNAGVVSQPKNLGITNEAHAERAKYEMDINYLGIIRMNNAFMDMLNSRAEPAIINTTSILSYQPFNLSPTYAASKVAVRFYTESLRHHLKIIDSPVKVFDLAPPLVATDMAEGMPAKAISPEVLVNHLISGLKKNQYVIRVGDTKVIYFLSRFFPKMAHKILNSTQTAQMLRT